MLLGVNLGPFAPVVGYISCAMAAVLAIWTLIWRKKIWGTPEGTVPNAAKGLILALIVGAMVWEWLDIAPENIRHYTPILIGAAITAFIFFLAYFSFIRMYTFTETRVKGADNQTETLEVIGGMKLKSSAQNIMQEKGIDTVQELLVGAGYDFDKLWTRGSREAAKNLIVISFFFLSIGANLTLITAGFMIQVKLTGKPASEVISKTGAPGLNTK
jgi:hypothetical protein